MVLDQDDRPALFLEKSYPEYSDLLFMDAAREIANTMKLPLYHRVNSSKGEAVVTGEEVKLLEGRAPYDYFDSLEDITSRREVTFSQVKCDLQPPRH